MGEILVMLTACGYRLDRIMGESEHMKLQRRLIEASLLSENGEPTSAGSAAAEAFLAKRDANLRAHLAALAAAAKQP